MIAGLVIVGLLFGGGFYYGIQSEKKYVNDRAIAALQLSCIKNGGDWLIDRNGEYICLRND